MKYTQTISTRAVTQTIGKYNSVDRLTFIQNKKYLSIWTSHQKSSNGFNLLFIALTFPKSLKFTMRWFPSKSSTSSREILRRVLKYRLLITLNNKLTLRRQSCTIVNLILNYYTPIDWMTSASS